MAPTISKYPDRAYMIRSRRYLFLFTYSAWIEESQIKPYQEFKEKLLSSCKSAGIKEAVQQIEEFIATPEKFNHLFSSEQENRPDPDVEFNKLREGSTESDEASVNNTSTPAALETVESTPTTGKKSAAKKKVRASLPIKLNVEKVVCICFVLLSNSRFVSDSIY